MINSPLKTHYTRFIFKLGPTVPLNVLWVFSLDLKYVSILDRKKTFLLKVFFCLSYSPNFYTILGDLFLIRGFIYFMYIFLKQKTIFPLSCFRKSHVFETRLPFSFLLSIYLVDDFFDFKFIGAMPLPLSLPLPLPLSSFQGKKRIGYLGTQSPNFSS